MLLRRQFTYLPILLIASAILLLKGGLYARLLLVEEFGKLSAAFLVITMTVSFGALGFNHLAHKLLPRFHSARDDEARANFIAASIAVYFGCTLLGIGGALIGAMATNAYSAAWVCAVAAAALTQFVFALQLIAIKSEFRFVDHAAWSLTRAVALSSVGAVVAWFTNDAQHVVLTEACVTAIMLYPMRGLLRTAKGKLALSSIRSIGRAIREHRRAAFDLLQLHGMIIVIYMLDRWIGVSVLSVHDFGIYSVALIVLMAFENLQAIIGVPSYPMLSNLMADGDLAAGYRQAFRISITLLLVGLALSVPGAWLLALMVKEFLPQYVAALAVIDVVLVAGVLRVSNFFGTFCILADQQRVMSRIALCIAGLTTVAALVAVFAGVELRPAHIAAIALGLSIASFTADFLVARRVVRLSTGNTTG